jgi:hypothetical protein
VFGVGSALGKLMSGKDEYEWGVLLYADRGREVSLLGLLYVLVWFIGQMADILGPCAGKWS